MKWFHHFSDAHQHPKIKQLIREFGSEGYYICFVTFEIISQYGDKYLRLNLKKYTKEEISTDLGCPQDRVEKVWACMIDKDLLDREFYKKGILYSKKLKEYSDDYTKRVRRRFGQGSDKVPHRSRSRSRSRSRTEIEKKRPPTYNYPTFQETNNPKFKAYLKSKYPEVDIELQFTNMETWIRVNPKKGQKKNYARFARNWVAKRSKEIEEAKPQAFRPEPPPPEKDNGLPKKKPTLTKKEEQQIHRERLALQKKIREKQGGKNGQGKTGRTEK